MYAKIHRPEWQKLETWLIWLVVLAAALLVVAPAAYNVERTTPARTDLVSLHPSDLIAPASGLPFTARDVVRYFSTVLAMSPERGKEGSAVFENHQATYPEDRWRIEIWPGRKSVVVQFTAGGEYGLNLAREFFESPLFEGEESAQFYQMFDDARNGPLQRLHRFTIGMSYQDKADLEVLVMKFTAPKAA